MIGSSSEFQQSLMRFKRAKMPLLFKRHKNSFQQSMKLPLSLLQILWIFPIEGIRGDSSKSLKMKLISWKVFYAVFCSLLQVAYLVVYCTEQMYFYSDITVKISLLIVLVEAILHIPNFLYLAYSWKGIVQQWEGIEHSMRHYDDPRYDPKKLIRFVLALFLVFLVGEYLVYMVMKKQSSLQLYYGVLLEVAYHIALIQRTFIWLFRDALIIIISACFTFRLRQVQNRLSFLMRLRVDNVEVWRSTREDYNKVLKACQLTNKKCGWLIVISYLANIQFLLITGFSALIMHHTIPLLKILQFYAIFFTIFRIFLVSFFGGLIESENEKILDLLLSVQSDIYNNEVERFLYQVTSKEMGLTGMNLFRITRGLILQIANVIVTYELIIIQFVENFQNIQ